MTDPQPESRAERKAATECTILDAVVGLIQDQGQFTIAEVADRSGISPATIYRYFPDRQSLINTVADFDTYRRESEPLDVAGLRELLAEAWRWQEENYDRIFAMLATPAGREMHVARLRERHEYLGRLLENLGIDPRSAAGARLQKLWLLIGSSPMHQGFHEVYGMSGEESSQLVGWAIATLIKATNEGWEIGDELD